MLSLYNTLSKKKESFIPLVKGKVGMYVCGPTVYGYIHIGNIRSYVMADTLRRTLEDQGYEVRMIKNITDVGHLTQDDVAQGDSGEDKLVRKALAEKKTPEEIAAFYEEYFHRTERAMNILPAQYFPRATAHIPQIIKLIEVLIAKGHAYEKHGNVFLDVTTFPEYGRLSGNTLENLKVGARLEEHPDKRHPWDFALWLKAPEGHLMRWPSPWSEGYPGWHIECSAMSLEYLGDTFDIHTGGEDNIFPHHEAEIVQSEGATEKPFARYFVHTRHMLVNGERMAKSKGNFYTLEDISARGLTPMDLRLLLLGAHYRSQMNFTWEALEQARRNKEALFGAAARLSDTAEETEGGYAGTEELKAVRESLAGDLNTPQALATALELARHTHTLLDTGGPIAKASLGKTFTAVFSLFGLQPEALLVPPEVSRLAEEREAARKEKRYEDSDRLRAAIESRGFKVDDLPGGFRLRKR